MKKRVITGLIAGAFAVSFLKVMQFPGPFGVVVSFFACIGCGEFFSVSGCKNKVLQVVAMIGAAVIPLYTDLNNAFNLDQYIKVPHSVILTVYVLLQFILMLKYYDITRFEHLGLSLVGSVWVPLALSTMYHVRDCYITYHQYFHRAQGIFMILCIFFCTWICDTFALFSGMLFGKHKFSPKISPKKTVEGFIGGVLGATIFCVVGYFVAMGLHIFGNDNIKWWMVALAALAMSVMGTLGDLSASVIKRNYGVKDYGNFFPGHGGVMDRIDSLIFVAPTGFVIFETVMAFVTK